MGRLTRWPEFLPCVIRDILDLFLLPTADLKCQRSLSGSKVTPLYMSVSTDIHTRVRVTKVCQVRERSRSKNDAFMHIKR